MNEISKFVFPIFEVLKIVHEKFDETEKLIRHDFSLKNSDVFKDCHDYNIADSKQKGFSYYLELSGDSQKGTTVLWNLEIDFKYYDFSCFLNAETGYIGKYGSVPLRELESVRIESIQELKDKVENCLKNLFFDLSTDIKNAEVADSAEKKQFNQT